MPRMFKENTTEQDPAAIFDLLGDVKTRGANLRSRLQAYAEDAHDTNEMDLILWSASTVDGFLEALSSEQIEMISTNAWQLRQRTGVAK